MTSIAAVCWTSDVAPLDAQRSERVLDAVCPGRNPATFRSEVRHGEGYRPIPGVLLACASPQAGDETATVAANESGDCHAIFEGHLDNAAALRHRLEGGGHRFLSQTDAEIVLHLYEQEGPSCFRLLDGPFIATVWDATRRRLVFARDHLGTRPLYYSRTAQHLCVASHPAIIASLPAFSREIDPTALDEYLTYGYVPHPHSLLRGIQKIPPGYVGIYHDGQLQFERYWEANFAQQADVAAAEASGELWRRIEETVSSQAGDDSIDVCISGGLASAAVALAAAKMQKDLRIRHVTMAQSGDDDGKMPAAVARLGEALRAEVDIVPLAMDRSDLLDALVETFVEPLGTAAALIPWSLAADGGAEGRIVLTGLGGDELLAGRRRYYDALSFAERLPKWMQGFVAANDDEQGIETTRALSPARQRSYLASVALFDEAARGAIYTEEHLATLPSADPADMLTAAFSRTTGRDPLNSVCLVDLQTVLPCSTTIAWHSAFDGVGLWRSPFLDPRVATWVAALPWQLKYRRGKPMWALRRALASQVPRGTLRALVGRSFEDVLLRDATWRPHARDVLLDGRTMERGIFDPLAVEELLNNAETEIPGLRRLWALLMLELWQRRWLDG